MQTVRSKTWNQFCTIPVEPRCFISTAFDLGRLVLNKQCTSCHYMVSGFIMDTAKWMLRRSLTWTNAMCNHVTHLLFLNWREIWLGCNW